MIRANVDTIYSFRYTHLYTTGTLTPRLLLLSPFPSLFSFFYDNHSSSTASLYIATLHTISLFFKHIFSKGRKKRERKETRVCIKEKINAIPLCYGMVLGSLTVWRFALFMAMLITRVTAFFAHFRVSNSRLQHPPLDFHLHVFTFVYSFWMLVADLQRFTCETTSLTWN